MINFSIIEEDGMTFGVILSVDWTEAPGRTDTILLRIDELSLEEALLLKNLNLDPYITPHLLVDNTMLDMAARVNKGSGTMVVWKKSTQTYEAEIRHGKKHLATYLDGIVASLSTGTRTLVEFNIVRSVNGFPIEMRTRTGTSPFPWIYPDEPIPSQLP